MSAYIITSTQFPSGIPSKVKIGPIEYRIILESNPKAKHGEEEVPVYGMVDFKKSQITIDDELTPMMQWQCLWHELVHIMFEQLGLDNDCEGQVDAFAYKILEILTTNGCLYGSAGPHGSTDPQFPAQETLKLQGYCPYTISLTHGE